MFRKDDKLRFEWQRAGNQAKVKCKNIPGSSNSQCEGPMYRSHWFDQGTETLLS